MTASEPLVLAGIEIDAISVGGLETCIHLPRHKVAFDIGRCPDSVVQRDRVLFTHAHMDHMGGVAWHCATRALRNMAPPTYVMPPENVDGFAQLMEAWRTLDRSDMEHTVVACAPGEEYRVAQDLVARPFRSPHAAPCQGYALVRQRRKLLPEFVGLPGEEIRRLRQEAGREVTGLGESIEVAFTGDARIEVVERNAAVRDARLLVMEVTFLDERVSVAECRHRGHIHLDEVIDRADLFKNEALLFTHRSARYSYGEARAILERRLPAGLAERVTLLP